MSAYQDGTRCEHQNGSKKVNDGYVINCSKRAKEENKDTFYIASEMCNSKCPLFSEEIDDYDWKDHWC